MKQPPHLSRAQARMAPGVLTMDGFLGADSRDLIEILQDDDGAVRRFELSHAELADVLQRLTDAAIHAFGAPVREGVYEVCACEARGVLPCPFGEPGLHPKAVLEAKRTDTGQHLSWTALQIHLIREHGFYEGRGSPFRLDPVGLARFLGLLPRQG
ncbi:MAG: hypothetical protein IH608_11475 [Proteobacteria bacterium]|nr:hypothetical protein [Pseudomonadota bacterium]